jgi:FkbM family methyltransferase
MHNSLLIKFPYFYFFFTKLRKKINYEKYFYLRNIKRGDIVLDIGANHGYYTSLFSEIISNSGQVHAFEPVPENFTKLKSLKPINKNVIFNHLAIGKRNETGIIRYNLNDLEKASLIKCCNTNLIESETQITTVDNYIKEFPLSNVNFIKCDVEGSELDVFTGSVETLKEFKPKLSIELTLNMNDTHELYHLLLSAGYRNFHKIEKGYPRFIIDKHHFKREDYFYLYATS